jgi:hypothetical protein
LERLVRTGVTELKEEMQMTDVEMLQALAEVVAHPTHLVVPEGAVEGTLLVAKGVDLRHVAFQEVPVGQARVETA